MHRALEGIERVTSWKGLAAGSQAVVLGAHGLRRYHWRSLPPGVPVN